MPAYDGSIINGPSGTTYTNDTDRILYQFHVSGINTCGICYQYSEQIGTLWPIPIHVGCRCRQSAIPPGKKAENPFVDFRKEIARLPHDQRVKVVGDSNYKLIQKGIVPWDEVVTTGRVRTLQEVVSRNNLTVERMVKAGVDPNIADRAWQRVHTPEHELVEKQRREIVDRLKKLGLPHDVIIRELTRRLVDRVTVDPGHGVLQVLPDLGRHAHDLVKLLNSTQPIHGTLRPKPRPKPTPKPTPPRTFEEALADRLRDMPADTLEGRKARRLAIRELIESYATAGPDGTFHGMTTPEAFRTIRYGGVDFRFSGPISALVNTIDALSRPGVVIPDRLLGATKNVYFTGQSNKEDARWRAEYKGFQHSGATGGDGDVVAYRNNHLSVGDFVHESAHNLSTRLYGSTTPGGDYARLLRLTPEKPVSAYAAHAPSEDFAEAVRLYVEDRDTMKASFPERFRIIDRIMTDPTYGG